MFFFYIFMFAETMTYVVTEVALKVNVIMAMTYF